MNISAFVDLTSAAVAVNPDWKSYFGYSGQVCHQTKRTEQEIPTRSQVCKPVGSFWCNDPGFNCFSKEIRATHDKIYFNEAFDNPKDRRYMEKQLHAVNRFKKLSCTDFQYHFVSLLYWEVSAELWPWIGCESTWLRKRERPGEAEVFDPTMVQHTLEGKVIEATSIGIRWIVWVLFWETAVVYPPGGKKRKDSTYEMIIFNHNLCQLQILVGNSFMSGFLKALFSIEMESRKYQYAWFQWKFLSPSLLLFEVGWLILKQVCDGHVWQTQDPNCCSLTVKVLQVRNQHQSTWKVQTLTSRMAFWVPPSA